MMNAEIIGYNEKLSFTDRAVCDQLQAIIEKYLPDAESKIWHAHPVWFLKGNPIVGYSKLKQGVRLMFWSGASFEEALLKPGTGKFKDASVYYTAVDQIHEAGLKKWLQKSRTIQWDYKNLIKRKGRLERIDSFISQTKKIK